MNVKILKGICGFKGNNDIVFVAGKQSPRYNIIYIGGDIQDIKCNMKSYANYSLEWSATLIHSRFEKLACPVHVYAIRPSLYLNSTFAIFQNFVKMIKEGHPIYKEDPLQIAATHLHNLIENAVKELLLDNSLEFSPKFDIPVHIMGFSKGCAVLTQLLYDMSQPNENQFKKWLTNINQMYWLDSGHNGESELWPISSEMLIKFHNNYNCSLHGYGTPFQFTKFGRERSFVEFSKFKEILSSFSDKHHCDYLLSDHNNDLETHFKILEVFPIFID